MEFSNKTIKDAQVSTEAGLFFAHGKQLSSSAAVLNKANSNVFTKQISRTDIKQGQVHNVTLPDAKTGAFKRFFLAQLSSDSKAKPLTEAEFRKAARTLANKMVGSGTKDLTIVLDELTLSDCDNATVTISKTLATEFGRAAYRYTTTLGDKNQNKPGLQKLVIGHSDSKQGKLIKQGLQEGKALSEGINFARELGNLPGNHCTPSHLADFAKSLANEHTKLSVKVLGEKALEKLKMGSLLSVSRGSAEEAKFIIFEYKGSKAAKPTVLVGKGITFDTGGISLKPGPAMDEMKFDMCGAASVFGTVKALAEMNAKVNIIGVVAAAENMPSSVATKPGDVVTSMSGKTIEILNTDAEGRLVLCDALSYVERFKPKAVVDIATLTGACVIALGSHATGLFANNQELADKLLKSGEATGDRAWQMPIWDEYHSSLKSNFADIANIGGREAGSVTAACFLSKFTQSYPWAHLDIAGTAWKSGAAKGATGRPVELLVDFLVEHA